MSASTSVTLAARVDPLGSSTEYRLEWGTSTAYGHVFSGNVGEGSRLRARRSAFTFRA